MFDWPEVGFWEAWLPNPNHEPIASKPVPRQHLCSRPSVQNPNLSAPTTRFFFAQLNRIAAATIRATERSMRLLFSLESLGLWSYTEDLDQAVRDHLVLAALQLPNGKPEAVGITIAGVAIG